MPPPRYALVGFEVTDGGSGYSVNEPVKVILYNVRISTDTPSRQVSLRRVLSGGIEEEDKRWTPPAQLYMHSLNFTQTWLPTSLHAFTYAHAHALSQVSLRRVLSGGVDEEDTSFYTFYTYEPTNLPTPTTTSTPTTPTTPKHTFFALHSYLYSQCTGEPTPRAVRRRRRKG